MNNMFEILQGVFDGSGLTTQPSNSAEILNLVVTDDGSALKVKINGGGGTSSGKLSDDINVIKNVGGYTIGDYIASGTTYDKIFHDMLEPVVYPTKTNNYSTITGVPTSDIEVGEAFNFTLTSSYNKGLIHSKDGVHGDIPLTGDANTTTYSGYGTVNSSTGLVNAIAGAGVMSWTVRKDYDAGTGNYYDSVGNIATNLDSYRVASHKDRSNTRTGKYKVWRGSSSSPMPTDSTSVRALPTYFFDNNGTENFTITIPGGERYIAFYIKKRTPAITVLITHQEAFDLDITTAYGSGTDVTIKDANNNDVDYVMFMNDLGGTGYSATNHHDVYIS